MQYQYITVEKQKQGNLTYLVSFFICNMYSGTGHPALRITLAILETEIFKKQTLKMQTFQDTVFTLHVTLWKQCRKCT